MGRKSCSIRFRALFMSICMLLTFFPVYYTPKEAKAMGSIDMPEGMVLTSRTDYALAPGVTEMQLVTNNESGNAQVKCYAAEVNMNKNVKIVANYGKYYKSQNPSEWDISGWSMSRTTSQAKRYVNSTGKKVVMATNGDYYNMSNGCPLGALVLNGKTYHAASGEPYFAILNDGSAVIREAGSEITDDVDQAVGGPFLLVKDGKVTSAASPSNTDLMPRNSVGIKKDGSVVFMVADGRNAPRSVGYTLNELANMLISLGCETAMYLDGGGSATYASRHEGHSSVSIKNRPSDGWERAVSSTIMIVSEETGSGILDHAALTPNNTVYTPGSVVQFEANGVDSTGDVAPLPDNLTWELAGTSASMGLIDANGLFVSNGTEGKVTVNLRSDKVLLGSTSVIVAKPDKISFDNKTISMGFNEESTLGLNVTYKGREVIYKDDDFIWTLSDEAMGSFTGNTFISNPSLTITGVITAAYKGNEEVKGNVDVEIGKLPFVVTGFEEAEDYANIGRVTFNAGGGQIVCWEKGNADDCKVITGHYCSNNADPINTTRGGIESAELVDLDSGEPVRFGSYSMKLNYDFTNANGTEGACVGFTEEQIITGSPKAIGMWVYVPENTTNLWLRIRVKDNTDTVQTLNFTEQPGKATDGTDGGLNWVGWKYVECDLTGIASPFTLLSGETIRLMYLNGVKEKSAGSIYIDNLQFVYGVNTDDTSEPVIDTIKANGSDITNGMVINDNRVTFEANYHDIENDYTTGIDYDLTRIYIDGVNMTNSASVYQDNGGNRIFFYDAALPNGPHNVKLLIRDGFGNETTETRNFVIKGNEKLPTVSLTPQSDELPLLGTDYTLNLTADNLKEINAVTAQMQLEPVFADVVSVPADGYAAETKYNEKTKLLSINVTKNDGTENEGEGVIASLKFKIPTDLKSGSTFDYNVISSKITYAEDKGDAFAASFATGLQSVKVAAPYKLSSDVLVAGMDGYIRVTDNKGNLVSGVSVINVKTGSVVGISDSDGKISAESLCETAEDFEIYADDKKGGMSFVFRGQSYVPAGSDDAKPVYVMSNGTYDSKTQINFTWVSNPLYTKAECGVMYIEKNKQDSADAQWSYKDGASKVVPFAGTNVAALNNAVRINSCLIENLKPGTEYLYRVGDKNTWSDVMSFKTEDASPDETNFFVIGDTQAEDISNLNKIIDRINSSDIKYDFGVQTGDAVENAAIYSDWEKILNIFNNNILGDVDMFHIIGNHETYGDIDAVLANELFKAPKLNEDEPYYSTVYGNVYVACIQYTDSKDVMKECLDWLKADAAKSNAHWKVLFMHQPSYYTNVTGGCEFINELVPPVCDQAEIDFVFSGHDHSFARTEQLYDRNVNKDKGTTYYICGSTGEKSYTITDNKDFHFAKLDDEYNAIYLSAKADATEFKVDVYESDGTLIDTFTKVKAPKPTEAPIPTAAASLKPEETQKPVITPNPTAEPSDEPVKTPEITKEPQSTQAPDTKPTASTGITETAAPSDKPAAENGKDKIEIRTNSLYGKTIYAAVGSKLKLGGIVTEAKDESKLGKDVSLTWKSSNKKVAAVSGNGTVRLKKAGKAVIRLTLSTGETARLKIVAVSAKLARTKYAVKKLSCSGKITLKAGQKKYLNVRSNPKKAATMLKFTSDKRKVARVDAFGGVYAVSAGICYIKVKTANGVTKRVKVVVK